MHYILKIVLFSIIIGSSLIACKKTQEQNAEAAKETIAEMKASTIDAAHEAAAKAEQAANDMAKAADEAGATVSGD